MSIIADFDAPTEVDPITPEDARALALTACGVAMAMILVCMIAAAWVFAHSDPPQPRWAAMTEQGK